MEFIDNSPKGFLIFADFGTFLSAYKQGTYVLALSPIRSSLLWSRAATGCTRVIREDLTVEGFLESRSEFSNNWLPSLTRNSR